MGCTESRTSEESKKSSSNEPFVLTKDIQFTIYDCIMNDSVEEFTKGLSQGLDINVRMDCFANRTPLHIACELGSEKILNLLIREGCDVNAEDDYGITPIFLASVKQRNRCVKILQEAQAVNAKEQVYSNSAKSSPAIRSSKALSLTNDN